EPHDEEMKDNEDGSKETKEEMGKPSESPHSTHEGEGPTIDSNTRVPKGKKEKKGKVGKDNVTPAMGYVEDT
ncbi:hypothetical protein KI387_009143, partial [Taxus chinensis]